MTRWLCTSIQAVLSLVLAVHLTAAPAAAQCGNGVIEPGEGCDPPGPCCSTTCQCTVGTSCGVSCSTPLACNFSGAPATCQCLDVGTPPPLDHYRVYGASGDDAPIVAVRDQFQTEDVDLGPVVYFLAPVQKDGEPVENEDDHLTCSQIPVGQFRASVDVSNQFGGFQLDVGNPTALCVPTQKVTGHTPPPLTIDHYKCYEATGSPVNQTVTLVDQFQSQSVQVSDPFLFCNPVDKNSEGITNPSGHLTCYQTDPPGDPPMTVPIRNQFDLFQFLGVFEPTGLCVPSTKDTVTLTACADSAPQCNGTCPPGQACVPDGAGSCECL